MNKLLTDDRSCKKKYFGKTLEELWSPHLYASFGIFCVQIGQLFAAQLVFKHSEEFRKSTTFSFDDSDLSIFKHCMLQRLTVTQMINRFGCKRCQKKPKDGDYKLLLEFFQKYGRLLKIRSVRTYVCYGPDVLF